MSTNYSTLHNCNNNAYASPSTSGSLTRIEPGSCGILTGSNGFGFSEPQPLGYSFNQRCASPLVLLNNVSTQFNNQPQSPQIEVQSKPFSQLRSRFQQPVADVRPSETQVEFGQLPKRTVSLGPRRGMVEQPFGGLLKKNYSKMSPGDCQNGKSDRERRFSRAADELQSSLTELNKLIDDAPQPRQEMASKPPKFKSYVTSTPEQEPSYARHFTNTFKPASPDSAQPEAQPFTWQLDIDPQNWKTSSSINDLRSMFELQKPTENLSSSSMTLNRTKPPRSSNASILRNSPFRTSETQQQPAGGLNGAKNLMTDYTIRRTISTSGRTNTRNPYRSHYGN